MAAPFWNIPDGQGEGKSSRWGELQEVHLLFIVLGRRHGLGMVVYRLTAVADDLVAWSDTWKEHGWKIGDKEVWGEGMWIDLSECSPCTSAWEDFNT